MTSSSGKRVETLARAHDGRLSAEKLEDVLSQVAFGEWGLAPETLAEHLYDEDVEVSSNELSAFLEPAEAMGIPESRFDFLPELLASRAPPNPTR